MSPKKYPILKYWLTTGSVAFVASCGCSLPFTQNLAHSGLIGLAAMPGVAASGLARSRHRKQQLDRQLKWEKLRLNELQQRGEVLTRQLQIQSKDCSEVEIRNGRLQTLTISLTDRIDRDRQQCQQLEDRLASLDCYCRDRQDVATKLDRKIQEKQARSLEIDSKHHMLKLEIARLQAAKLHLISEIESARIIDRVRSDEFAAEIVVHSDAIESSSDDLDRKLQQRELKIARLELSSRHAELDNLDVRIQVKRQQIDDINLAGILKIFDPKRPIISRGVESIGFGEAWHQKFIDNPHLAILQHIEKHGTMTEAEASSKLGDARSIGQFADKLAEYPPDLPLSIRVESSPIGDRYFEETQN